MFNNSFLILAVAPTLFVLWVFLRLLRSYDGKIEGLVIAFLLGMSVAPMLALVLNQLVTAHTLFWEGAENPVHRNLFWILGVGLNEEGAKGLVLLWVLRPTKSSLPSLSTGLIAATAVSGAFAATENLLYLHRFGAPVFLSRSLITIPAHIGFTLPLGYALAMMAHYNSFWAKYVLLMGGLAIAVIFHGGYDMVLSMGVQWGEAFTQLQVLLMGLLGFWLIRRARMHSSMSQMIYT